MSSKIILPTHESSTIHQPFTNHIQSATPISGGLHGQVVNTVSTVLVGHQGGALGLAAVGLAVSLANVTGYSATWPVGWWMVRSG